MRVLDPTFVALAEASGIEIDENQQVSFDDDPLINLINFYRAVYRNERRQFGDLITRMIERERQSY
ncbi:MAG: hypothetical protein RL156_1772 [Bacteroidota bacterium]|jgi:hypothetical protein